MAFYTSTHRSVSRALFEAKNQVAAFVANGHLDGRGDRGGVHLLHDRGPIDRISGGQIHPLVDGRAGETTRLQEEYAPRSGKKMASPWRPTRNPLRPQGRLLKTGDGTHAEGDRLHERVGRVSVHLIVHGAEGIRQSRQFFVAFQHPIPKVHPQSVALAEKAQE